MKFTLTQRNLIFPCKLLIYKDKYPLSFTYLIRLRHPEGAPLVLGYVLVSPPSYIKRNLDILTLLILWVY